MIHSGAVVAAGVSQGRSSTFKFDLKVGLQVLNVLTVLNTLWSDCVQSSVVKHVILWI